MTDNLTDPSLNRSEHVEENVQAKRTIPYNWDGTNLFRAITGLFSKPYDEIKWVGAADVNNNYPKMVTLLSSATQQTFDTTYDATGTITDIKRTN